MSARRATDMHDIRAQLREAREQRLPSQGEGKNVKFWVVAVCAVVVGFAVVLFTPRIYSVQRTAALPTFQETRDRIEAETRGEMAPAVARAGQIPRATPARPRRRWARSRTMCASSARTRRSRMHRRRRA